jgi:hypothetical protein
VPFVVAAVASYVMWKTLKKQIRYRYLSLWLLVLVCKNEAQAKQKQG